jgi:hypothetical protein
MGIKRATTVLNDQCYFLGLTWDELMLFIQRSPYAQSNSVIEAHRVYVKETV